MSNVDGDGDVEKGEKQTEFKIRRSAHDWGHDAMKWNRRSSTRPQELQQICQFMAKGSNSLSFRK